MTDSDDDREDRLAELRAAFDAADAPPTDVVDRGAWRGLTAEDIRALNDSAGTWAEVTTPGEIKEDVEGIPSGVGPSTTNTVYRGGAVVTRSQLYKVGLTEADVPNLIVMNDPKERKKENE